MAPGVRPRAGWDSPAANMAGAVQGTARRMRAIWQSSEPLMPGAMPPRTARPQPEPEPEDGSREPPLQTAAHSLQFNIQCCGSLGYPSARRTQQPAPLRFAVPHPAAPARQTTAPPCTSLFRTPGANTWRTTPARCPYPDMLLSPTLPLLAPRRLPRPALRSPAPTRAAATTLPAPPTPHCSAWPPRVIGGCRAGLRTLDALLFAPPSSWREPLMLHRSPSSHARAAPARPLPICAMQPQPFAFITEDQSCPHTRRAQALPSPPKADQKRTTGTPLRTTLIYRAHISKSPLLGPRM